MPHYFLQLRNEGDDLLDLEGIEIPAEAAAQTALHNARDVLAEDLRRGRIDLRYRIDVEDECGSIVHSLAFADAVEIIPPR